MMKKVTVAVFASIMLGAFGACKNEPDNIYVTPSLPVDPHEVGSEEVGTERPGIGGDHATTTKLWFKLDRVILAVLNRRTLFIRVLTVK